MANDKHLLDHDLEMSKKELELLEYQKRISKLKGEINKDKKPEHVNDQIKPMVEEYKVLVLLSIFLDIFLIFSIAAFIKRFKLESAMTRKEMSSEVESSFRSWDAIFWVFVFLKVLLFCGIASTAYLG